jgi:multimeric flavodoxin WrbA
MKRILIVYHSQERGNTRRLAGLVAKGCRKVKGVRVSSVNVNESRVDLDAAERADAYALGSPDYFTYMAGGMKQFFDDILLASWRGRRVTGKPYVAFETHGGGGGAIKSIERLAKAANLTRVADSVICRDSSEDPKDIRNAIALGEALANYVVKDK